MDTADSWIRLNSSLTRYRSLGYKYVNAPWMVPYEYQMATCPDEAFLVTSQVGYHVGSAEQSFLYLDSMKVLGEGRFCAMTPCFRNEPVVGELHQHGFMKVELYQNVDVSKSALEDMMHDARYNFEHMLYQYVPYLNLTGVISERKTDDGYDIEIAGIEVGSYGIREWRGLRWVYGTGVAEPRFSVALQRVLDLRQPAA